MYRFIALDVCSGESMMCSRVAIVLHELHGFKGPFQRSAHAASMQAQNHNSCSQPG